MLARFLGHFFHETMHALVSVVVVVDDLLGLFARDADALRETEGRDRRGDGEVDDLGEAARLLQLLRRLGSEDQAGRARVYVVALLKRVEHLFIARDVREQPKLKLRIVRRDELVAFGGDEGAANAAAKLRAYGNVLKVGLAEIGRAHV